MSEPLPTRPELLLAEGGPGAALLKRLRLIRRDAEALSPRTAVILAAVTWLPLFLLSAVGGVLVGGVQLPFLDDIASQTRFLFAVPVLVLAERPVGARLRQTIQQFIASGLVRPEEEELFAANASGAVGLRDSRIGELMVLGLAYLGTYTNLRTGPVHGLGTWYEPVVGGSLTAAGDWYGFVALPIFQFLIFRWVFRMVVWAWFLWRTSKLSLRLTPIHPDGAGGLGFLGRSCAAFGPVLFAMSAVLSAGIATNVLVGHAKVEDYQQPYIALFLLAIAVFAGPMVVFAPTLLQLKKTGLLDYGSLAGRYTRQFHAKWIDGEVADEPLLGTADIQSLADLGNSYELVRKMRAVPIEFRDFLSIALPGALPALPLLALVMPVSEILQTLLKLLG